MECFICMKYQLNFKSYIGHLKVFHKSTKAYICHRCKIQRKKSIQEVIDILNDYANSGILGVAEEIIIKLYKSANIENTGLSMISDVFSMLKNSFVSILSEHKRKNILRDCGDLEKYQSIIIGERIDMVNEGREQLLKTVDVKASFISIKSTLISLFQSPGVLDKIENYVNNLKRNSESMSNLIQSTFWKNKVSNFSSTSIVYPIILYYDDFNTNNTLGSKSDLGSLGAVYISLPCIPPEYNSKLDNIFLVMLFHSLDKKRFGNRIFQKLIDELIDLETNGIKIFDHVVYFVLAACIGDNKGLNSLLGYTECFMANFFCRFCKMHRNDIRNAIKEDKVLLRNKTNYENDLSLNDVSKTGITSKCIFNQIPSYHVTENFSVDLMHDLLEGVLNLEISYLLYDFIHKEKFFELRALNNRINFFDFSFNMHINKPSEIMEEHLKAKKLRYSSSEIFWLTKYLGILIGDFIPDNNKKWEVFLVLKQICDKLFLLAINDNLISELEELISYHHQIFMQCFSTHLRPKHHYMTHYCHIMKLIGPLIQLWSMRHEAKHKVLKDIANSTTSRKNICQTIVERYLLSDSNIKNSRLEVNAYQYGRNLPLNTLIANKFNLSQVAFYSWVQFNSVRFKIGSIIEIGYNNENSYKIFGKICDIIISSVENYKKFNVKSFYTEFYDYHRQAFVDSDENNDDDDNCDKL
ncbi:uncharacterized protein LOC129606032 [Condylostylus longicornis]|uniref:uncharacterized protein LOC129606032 n=1 Tax=Condylostylus longicornis TaxID=2530218 RepID=UPI00244E49E0|nr:uncharacterized protein LOC129606032 [Condylostylus longicornis]